jgi:hypothetical protein
MSNGLTRTKLFLFSMNNTITRENQHFEWNLEGALKDLMNFGDIGIISSTDMPAIREQLGKFLDYSSIRYHLHILPCNGTQWFSPPPYHDREILLRAKAKMEDHLGPKSFQKLMKIIVDLQSIATDDENIRMKGSFIHNRRGLIHWCPIGLDSSPGDREQFELYDVQSGFRKELLSTLRKSLSLTNFENASIEVRLSNSGFDIFPKGWDKSVALNHFEERDVWFVGSNCDTDGSDSDLYNVCKDQGYVTTGPSATVDVVYDIISRIERMEGR